MRRDQATLATILDRLAEGWSISATCRSLKLSESAFWMWHAASLKGDSRFLVTWSDQVMQLADAVKLARARSIILFESRVREELLHGTEEVVIEGGRVCWQEDPEYVGVSDDTMRFLGLDPVYHRLKRDEHGHPIPLTRKLRSPAHLQIKALAALVPGYGERKTLDVQVGGGVHVIRKSGEQSARGPQMVDVSPMRAITGTPQASDELPRNALVVGGTLSEAEFDQTYLGKKVEDVSVEVEFEDVTDQPEQAEAEPSDPLDLAAPMSLSVRIAGQPAAPVENKPLTALQRNLTARAAEAPKNPRPLALGAMTSKPEDERGQRDTPRGPGAKGQIA